MIPFHSSGLIRNGQLVEPWSIGNCIGTIMMLGMGLVFFVLGQSGRAGFPPFIGLLIGGFAVFHLFRSWIKAKEFTEAEGRYLSRRRQLMADLTALEEKEN